MERFIIKEGLVWENGELYFYKHDKLYHAGVVKQDDTVYYIGSHGKAVKGDHIVHGNMANGILKRGTYTFGDDYALIPDSYRAPHKTKVKSKRSRHHKPVKTFLKKHPKFLKHTAIVAAVCVLLLVGLHTTWYFLGSSPTVTPSGNQNASQAETVVLSDFEQDVPLCSEAAKKLFDREIDITKAVALDNVPYRPLVFKYRLKSESGVLRVSEDSTMSAYREFELRADLTSINIDNLKTDTTYYYQLLAGDDVCEGSFHTARSNRFLSLPALQNVRDIGGYETLDGKTVKQGLLIRGVEIDGLVNGAYFLPEDAVPAVQNTFGFVYELDLRSSNTYLGDYRSRLGDDVGHAFYTAPAYGDIFNPEYYDSVKRIFSSLANPKHYPMYMHCTWGADRTGTIVFLLQGLLNMSEEDMLGEYRLTSFVSRDYIDNSNIDALMWGLNTYKGATLQEKIVSYLTGIGVTKQEIASIRSLFLS